MILINLLPPELRKARRTGVNPVWLAAAAGLLIVLSLAGTWAWIRYSRIPAAEQQLADLDIKLQEATARAEVVRKLEQEITAFEQLYTKLTGLITRKVFWARTLDDFANLLSQKRDSRWSMEGYDVRCTSLTISAASGAQTPARRGGGGGGDTVTFDFRVNLKIYGDEVDKAGDYIRSFFQSVDLSRFWRDNGFVGMSEEQYRADTPVWKEPIKRVVIDMPMQWRRTKVIEGAKR